jgi:putative hydroxymethylpyrimidine transport system substrate-binding protein
MGKRRSVYIFAVLTLIIGLTVIAFTNNRADEPPKEAVDQPEVSSWIKTRVSLMLDRYPNAMHAFIYTAIANGYFKEQGIELQVKQPGEVTEGVALVALGAVDLTITSQPQVLMARADEKPVVAIASIVRHPMNYLMVPKESVIQTPKNLAHRKLGYPGDGISLAILKTMMRADDGDPDEVKLVNVKRDFVQSIASHKVDAIIGGNINQDRIILANRMQPVRTIEPMLYGVPEYYEQVLIANEHRIEEDPELFRTIWGIFARAQKDVADNPEKAIELIMKKQNKSFPLTKSVEEESMRILLPFMANEDAEFGVQSKASWAKVNKWLEDTGMMRQSIDSDDAYTHILE